MDPCPIDQCSAHALLAGSISRISPQHFPATVLAPIDRPIVWRPGKTPKCRCQVAYLSQAYRILCYLLCLRMCNTTKERTVTSSKRKHSLISYLSSMIVTTKGCRILLFCLSSSLLGDSRLEECCAALALTVCTVLPYLTGSSNKALSRIFAGLVISTLLAGYGVGTGFARGPAADNATHTLICAERPHIVARLTTFESVRRNVNMAFLWTCPYCRTNVR